MGGAGPEVRLQQGLHRAQHLLVLLGAVVDSCCGSEVRDELGGVYLLLLGAALLRHLDGFTQDEEGREAGVGGKGEVARAQLGVVDLLTSAVCQEVEQAHPHLLVEAASEEVASVVSIVTEVALWAL